MNIGSRSFTVTLIALLATSASATETTYRGDIRPLWQQKCAACHDAQSPYLGEFKADKEQFKKAMKGPRMDTYADLIFYVGWPDTGAIMRRLDDGQTKGDGKPGNMYQYLGSDEQERKLNLGLFKAWVGEGAWTLKRSREITTEELARIKVPY
ncbi:MAG: cytochrome C [Chromatiales bacterium]|nr:cytochrome C [Chromatiales bacterium]